METDVKLSSEIQRAKLSLDKQANSSRSKFDARKPVFTPKELRHIAQGCSRSELPWDRHPNRPCTPKGFRRKAQGRGIPRTLGSRTQQKVFPYPNGVLSVPGDTMEPLRGTTAWGERTQGSSLRSQPWAM